MSESHESRRFVGRPWDLPVLPGTAERLAAITLEEPFAEESAAALVRSDPGLATAVLAEAVRLDARSFGESLDLEAAVHRVGRKRMRRLAFLLRPLQFSGAPEEIGGRPAAHRRLWQHAVALAAAAREVARELQLEGAEDRAHALGLFVHVGALSLQMELPDRAVELRARMRTTARSELGAVERELFGIDRFSHGRLLARSWKLSHELRDVLGALRPRAGTPEDIPSQTLELVHVLRAAEIVIAHLGLSSFETRAAPRIDTEIGAILEAIPERELGARVRAELERAGERCAPLAVEPKLRAQQLRRTAHELSLELQESDYWLSVARSVNEVMQYGLRRLDDRDPLPGLLFQAVAFMGYRRMCHLTVHPSGERLVVALSAAPTISLRVEEGLEIPYDPESPLFARSCVVMRDAPSPEARALLDMLSVSSCLLAPMDANAAVSPGFLCADRGDVGLGVVPGEERGFGLIAEQAGHLLHYEEMARQMRRLATMDPLTGAATRRRLMDRLEFHIGQYERTLMPLSLVILDLDHFKKFNDTMGHQVGDRLLQDLVKVLEANVRHGDLVARYGGEEFVVVLPLAQLDDGLRIANELRKAVWEYGQESAAEYDGMSVSISVGVTTMIPGDTAMSIIGRADAALYKAKNNGRNRVETAA